jgi:tetratricopeptide (TPR) repeat protein
MNVTPNAHAVTTDEHRTDQEPAMDLGGDPMAYEWLRLGVRAALDGAREDARYYFVQAVRTDLDCARAWLYLGGVADDPALTLSCVQKALQLDPSEPQARAGLIWARNKLGLIQPLLPVWPAAPPPAPTPALGPARPFTAPAPPSRFEDVAPAGGRALPALAPPPAPVSAAPADEDDDSRRLVRRGAQAAADGDRGRARYYFLKAIAADSGNVRAWLYYGGVADDPSTTLACMERVLRVEPENREARAGAEWAVRKLGLNAPALRWWR